MPAMRCAPRVDDALPRERHHAARPQDNHALLSSRLPPLRDALQQRPEERVLAVHLSEGLLPWHLTAYRQMCGSGLDDTGSSASQFERILVTLRILLSDSKRPNESRHQRAAVGGVAADEVAGPDVVWMRGGVSTSRSPRPDLRGARHAVNQERETVGEAAPDLGGLSTLPAECLYALFRAARADRLAVSSLRSIRTARRSRPRGGAQRRSDDAPGEPPGEELKRASDLAPSSLFRVRLGVPSPTTRRSGPRPDGFRLTPKALLFFPLSTRGIVGTDLYHGAIVTIAAAVAAVFWLPTNRLPQ